MIKEITMPAAGQTTDISTVGTWLVKKGDQVSRGDALLEVETDKATLTVESFAKGTVLALLVEEGDTASAGEAIAYIGDEDEYQPIAKSKKSIVKEKLDDTVKAMPNAKLLAHQENLVIAEVAKSLKKNVLKKTDIQTYVQQNKKQDGLVPLTSMRKVIAKRMLESSQSIPSYQITVEVKVQQCIAFRKKVNNSKKDIKISYNDIWCKCIEVAVRKFPYINASWSEKGIVLHKEVNVGLAVSLKGGLVVPVVSKVAEKGIAQIAALNVEHVQKARDGSLLPEEMTGGTITLSNLGMYPVSQFNAVINPPEVCILAIGAIEEKPVLDEGTWRVEEVIRLTGTFDHRVIDGAYAAEFLTELKDIVENPILALL